MLETLKKWGTDLTLKVKDLLTSPESQVYVKGLRKVMMYDGRKCQYPKNYDQIVQSAEIIKNEDMHGNAILDKDKNPTYKLLYGQKDENGEQPSFRLSLVTKDEDNDRSYFTIDFLVDPDKDAREFRSSNRSYYSKYYKPFGFSKIDLEKHIPIFEVDTQSLELTHSRVLAKKGSSLNNKGEVDEKDIDEKGRNGKLLYTSDYKKLSTHFSEIRDQNGNLELDKSLISVPIVFATSLAKVCTKLLTSLPMKLGEYLIGKQNPIAKSFGYLLFTPAMAIKNLVNMGATILKAPILLFVANEKKYGDAYYTMWKHQLKGCLEEAKSDFNVIKGGERLKPDHGNRDSLVGTWDELNARRPKKQGNDKEVSKSNEILKSPEEEQNKGNEILSDKRKGHVEELQNRRNSQQGQGATYDHSH
ncbi:MULTISPECIES: hypothetical protein [Wolbachia]|uniref:hypothetical protein n=1 Tax=Wolbachia TaxID=953 RepID=UPI0015FAD030|nr:MULTISPECIES: hypothetical protein [Wolbachia]MBA8757399.1 hypothetical protein [Wolbachia pipientis]MDE5058438.1 hypothetical protein [Wolbachia endosymbiont of Drosophila baimaii]